MSNSDTQGERLGRVAAASLSSGSPGALGPCPDAAELAGWLDRSPGSAGRTEWDGHVASCARCQEVLSAFVKAEPPGPDVRPVPVPASGGSGRVRRPLWRWILPVAATTAAAVVWFVVRPLVLSTPAAPTARPETETALVVGAGGEASTAERGPASPLARAQNVPAKAAAPAAAPAARERKRVAPRPRDLATPAADAPTADTLAPVAPPQTAPPAQKVEGVVAAPSLAAAAPAAPSPAGIAPPGDPKALPGTAGAAAGEFKAANRAQAAQAAPGAGLGPRAAKVAAETETILIVAAAGDPAMRWLARPAGTIERTTDAGMTWTRVTSGVPHAVLAGSAPTPTVCWLVGRRGLVLRTRDGSRFDPVTPPADTDLVAVRATDALTAVVTAGDGRVYRTLDGGATWRR